MICDYLIDILKIIYFSIIVLKNNNLRQYNVYGIYDVIIYILVIYINLINLIFCGIFSKGLLLERSKLVKPVQFLMAPGNWPSSPISESRIFKILFSSGCQHLILINLQMKPSILLLKFHEVIK